MANSLFYSKALPPSFIDGTTVGGAKLEALTGANAAATYKDAFGLAPGETPEFGVDNTGIQPPSSFTKQPGWTFITAPKDISWNIANASNRVEIFGTNNPPVTAGTKGMRELTLNDSLVEGFVRKVTVEGKIIALEELLKYTLNKGDGFVSVPVYEIWANSKSYGGSSGSAGYFIFKDIRVNEKLRDLKGNTTRATVDVSFMQVPAYQVNTGRDQATATTAGRTSKLLPREAPKPGAAAAAAAANEVDKNLKPGNKAAAGAPATTGSVGQSKQSVDKINDQIKPTTGRQRD
jgi:hypothetical protein